MLAGRQAKKRADLKALGARYGAWNLIDACVPSQKGLLRDAPQRHRVTRLRTSYSKPSAATTAIPPRSQIGPAQASAGSSIRPMETGRCGSIVCPDDLSHATSRPAGQLPT